MGTGAAYRWSAKARSTVTAVRCPVPCWLPAVCTAFAVPLQETDQAHPRQRGFCQRFGNRAKWVAEAPETLPVTDLPEPAGPGTVWLCQCG